MRCVRVRRREASASGTVFSGGAFARSAVALACAVVALLQPPSASAARLALRFADGRSGPSLPLERLEVSSDELYVPANGLCAALDLDTFWKPETRKLVIKAGERRIQATVDTRLVLDGNDEVLLRVPVRYQQGTVMLPLEFLERALGPALGATARLDRGRLEFVLGPANSDVLAVEYLQTQEGTQVRVRLAQPFQFNVQATSDEVVRILLPGARVDPLSIAADQPAPLVRNARAEQSGRNAAIYLSVVPIAGVTSGTEDEGRTVVVTLMRDELYGSESARGSETQRPSYVRPLIEMPTATADSFDLLALDAGHGGFDTGVQAAGRVEKELTLDLARRLQPILERELGLRVLLLRAGDETLSAQTRAEIANRAGADALLSLHCNGWFDPSARGFEVFYPAPARTTRSDATLVASRNGVADFNPWDTAYMPHSERSAILARCIAAELEQELDSPDRGSRAAPVELLLGAAMPSAEIEVGFLTDRKDASTIGTEKFADRLGTAIANALRRYEAQIRGRPAPARGGPSRGAE